MAKKSPVQRDLENLARESAETDEELALAETWIAKGQPDWFLVQVKMWDLNDLTTALRDLGHDVDRH